MRIISLQSGSAGNCLYIEASGVRLLIDAGISGKQAGLRLAAHGIDIADADALIISHDHADHAACAGIFRRKFGVPLYITRKTLRAANSWHDLGALGEVNHFSPGAVMRFGPVRVETFATPHDGAEGAAFIIDDGACRLGVFTDLGHVYGDLRNALSSVHAAVLESNYDPAMLDSGPYPNALKNRIRGKGGHLSNLEAAELVASEGVNLRWVCLAHLSGENNTPEIARSTLREVAGESLPCHVAPRRGAGPVIEV